MVGGHPGSYQADDAVSSCEVLNVSSLTWSSMPAMTQPRESHRVVPFNNRLVAIAGYNLGPIDRVYLKSCEQYNPATGTWVSFPSVNVQRVEFAAAVVLGKIYIAGGYGDTTYAPQLEVFSGGVSATRYVCVNRVFFFHVSPIGGFLCRSIKCSCLV